jgi:hypothetical protein
VHSVIDSEANKGVVLGVLGVAKPIGFATLMSMNPLASHGFKACFWPVFRLLALTRQNESTCPLFWTKKGGSVVPEAFGAFTV